MLLCCILYPMSLEWFFNGNTYYYETLSSLHASDVILFGLMVLGVLLAIMLVLPVWIGAVIAIGTVGLVILVALFLVILITSAFAIISEIFGMFM